MHADAGTSLTRPTAAHRAILAPASVARQRAGGRFHLTTQELRDLVQRQAAIREAEDFLAYFNNAFSLLESELQPVAIRQAVWSLTITELADPLQTELRLDIVAAAAGLPKMELRRQIKERAEFFRRFHELHERQPKQAEGALCELILA